MIGAISNQVRGLWAKDEAKGESESEGAILAERTKEVESVAKVGAQAFHIGGSADDSRSLLQALKGKKEENEEKDVSASIELSAELDLTGNNPKDVLSAVHTSHFFMEQLVRDIENYRFQKGVQLKGGSSEKRVELLSEFHAHMAGILADIANTPTSGTSLELKRQPSSADMFDLAQDFRSIEGILEMGAEAYIAEIRKLMKVTQDHYVNIFFQGLSYNAYIRKTARSRSVNTVATVLWDATLGGLCRCLSNMCRKSEPTDYVALEDFADSRPGYELKRVLCDLTGMVRNSRLTLIIGPPGCGKTSLLKALAGHLHHEKMANTAFAGQVRFNEFLIEEIKNLANWSSFVGQTDEHMSLLTVRETLEFAWRCRKEARHNSKKQHAKNVELYGEQAANRMFTLSAVEVDFVMAVLGLSNCSETIIGNETLKGVSGGEKRRVTLGEMLVTGTQVLCLDEISTGLDSAATYDICRYLSATAHFLGNAIVVGLLQPPPEVVELFDDVIVLGEGHIIYQGPLDKCEAYFRGLGFECPPHKDFGDFLQELPTDSGQRFCVRRTPDTPTTPAEFAKVWKESPEGRALEREVQESVAEAIGKGHAGRSISYDELPVNSWVKELWIVLQWTWKNKVKNNTQSAAKVINNLFMGLLYGTLFWKIGKDEWYLKAMLFQTVPGIMQQTALGDMQELVKVRGIFYKQHAASFYSAFSFTASQFLVNLPYTLFDALVFGNFVYFMCGLDQRWETWLNYMCLASLYALQMSQQTRLYAYIGRNQDEVLVYGVLTLLLYSTFNGSIATPSVIPDYLSWIFWLNPSAWAIRALAINEFSAPQYDQNPCPLNLSMPDCSKPGSVCAPRRCGDFYLENRDFKTDTFYLYGTYVVFGAYIILFFSLTTLALAKLRFGKLYSTREDKSARVGAEEEAEEEVVTNGDEGHVNVRVSRHRRESIMVKTSTLAFSDVWYTVNVLDEAKRPVSLDLLKGVSGWARPGRLTALMGSSGAGKTTLLDVLAGRKTTGKVRGHILVNHAPVDFKSFKRMVGYVEQFGIHDKYSTVKESLLFSAGLRLPKADRPKMMQFVQEMLDLLELDKISDSVCASLSVEENKKLTIAVEMVANPSVLFADEPTSGLDARGAMIVMRCIQNVALAGRTVISTIHQPSRAVFSMFDDLLLMRKGGKVVFFGELGENSSNLIDYFEAIPGTTPCPQNYNPATWMLEVIGAGTVGNTSGIDFADLYLRSELYQQNRKIMKYEMLAPDSAEDVLPAMQYLSPSQRPLMAKSHSTRQVVMATPMTQRLSAQKQMVENQLKGRSLQPRYSFFTQFWYLFRRASTGYWRAPEFSLSRLVVILFVAILNTMVFWQQEYHTAAEVQSRLTVIKYMAFLSGIYNLFTIMPFAIEKRALYFRETSSGMYAILGAVLSDGFAEIPYLLVETVIGVNVMYWGIGFSGSLQEWAYYSLIFFIYVTLMTYIGLLFAGLMPDPLTAQLSAVLMVLVIENFSGVLVPYNKLPSYYKWLYYFSPQTYILEGMFTTQFHDDMTQICNPTGIYLTLPAEMDQFRKAIITWLIKKETHGGWVCTADGSIPLHSLTNFSKYITGESTTAAHYILDEFLTGFKYENIYWDLVVLFIWIAGLRVLTVIVALTVNHNKR